MFGDVYKEKSAAGGLLEVRRKPNLDAYPKSIAFEAMKQLVFHYPETKKVAVWLGDLLELYIENKYVINAIAVCDIEYRIYRSQFPS